MTADGWVISRARVCGETLYTLWSGTDTSSRPKMVATKSDIAETKALAEEMQAKLDRLPAPGVNKPLSRDQLSLLEEA